jgi:hypothetical protein
MPLAGELVRASDIGGDIGCRLRRVAVQSVSSGVQTAISWDTEDQDTSGFITTTDTTVTVPAGLGGLYAVTAFASSSPTALAGRCFIEVAPTTTITGTPNPLRLAVATNGTDARYLLGIVLPLNAADSFVVNVFHTIGAATNHTAWLSCYRIAAF